jgi:hypothetical protein
VLTSNACQFLAAIDKSVTPFVSLLSQSAPIELQDQFSQHTEPVTTNPFRSPLDPSDGAISTPSYVSKFPKDVRQVARLPGRAVAAPETGFLSIGCLG